MNDIVLTNAKIRYIAEFFGPKWDSIKGEVKLSGKALYNMIAVKRQVLEKAQDIDGVIMALADRFGGEVLQNGSIHFPEDKVSEVNSALQEAMNVEATIQFNPICLKGNDTLPADLMEALFDFIEFE